MWMACLKLLPILQLFVVAATGSEVFTALNDFSQAVAAGRLLADELQVYLEREETRIIRLRRMIEKLENATQGFQKNDTDLSNSSSIANPVSVFLAIIQLASNWTKELAVLFGEQVSEEVDREEQQTKVGSSAFEEFDARRNIFLRLKWYADLLPGTNDVEGASDAIIRLQQTYMIPANEVADGHIISSSDSPKLTDVQCFRLGRFAYLKGEYGIAQDWFKFLLQRMDSQTSISEVAVVNGAWKVVPRVIVLEHLAYALGRNGKYSAALETTKAQLKEDPNSETAIKNKAFYETEIARHFGHDPLVDSGETDENSEMAAFERLCRTAVEQYSSMSSPASVCRLVVPHPFFLLGPIREEVMQTDPPILLWHDFVSQAEVDGIIEIARPRLRRATVRNPRTGKLESAPYRITKNVWLPNNLNELTKSINKRIEMVTGLNLEHAEELQVANYGLGGHYAPHFDHARNFELDAYETNHGNRIATFMIYLTHVEAGGATVFTRTGGQVRPEPRSAVFWYNLRRNGQGDDRSRHGACPVLAGSKWVMNKWIRSKGQEFRRPCLNDANL